MIEANLAALPVLAPLFFALFGLVLTTPSHGRRLLLALGAAAQVAIGFLALHGCQSQTVVLLLGGWLAPYGISLVVDPLAALMLLFSSLAFLASVLYGYGEKSTAREHPLRVPLMFLLLAGVNLALVTGDLFNLFVAFEVMLLASYALLTLESDAKEVPVALPYVAINLIGSTLFLMAAGLCYGWLGTLNFADLIGRFAENSSDPRLSLLAILLLLVFGTKAGVFPLLYWLPKAYPVLPAGLAALFGGLLTKVGVYILIRFFCTILPMDLVVVRELLVWIGAITLVIGGLAALSQYRIQSILTWHIVSQIGFMVLALALGSETGVAAALLITLHNILVKASLLLCGGAVGAVAGTDDVRHAGGLWLSRPVLGLLFLVQALSLAGIPPLSGFWGKLLMFDALAEQQRWVLVSAAVFGSLLTLASMLKIWLGAFWSPRTTDVRPAHREAGRLFPIGLLAVAALACGPAGGWFVRQATHAAGRALDAQNYHEAVRPGIQQRLEVAP